MNGDTQLETCFAKKNQVHVISFRKFKRPKCLLDGSGKICFILGPYSAVGLLSKLEKYSLETEEIGSWVFFGENELGGFGSSLGFNQKTL